MAITGSELSVVSAFVISALFPARNGFHHPLTIRSIGQRICTGFGTPEALISSTDLSGAVARSNCGFLLLTSKWYCLQLLSKIRRQTNFDVREWKLLSNQGRNHL